MYRLFYTLHGIFFFYRRYPDAIIVYFPNYKGPQFFHEIEKKNFIPIGPKTSYAKKIGASRKQFPIRLAYAIETHKTQGDTLTKEVIINVGKTEKNLGTTFVQFSRLKKITDFLCYPFPYSRLTKIALCKALPSRNAEEANLNKLTIETKPKYSYLIEK
jgi:hypothetical protein